MASRQSRSYRWMKAITLSGGGCCIFTYEAYPASYQKYLPEVEKMIERFQAEVERWRNGGILTSGLIGRCCTITRQGTYPGKQQTDEKDRWEHMMVLIIVVAIHLCFSILFGALSAYIAKTKGRSVAGFFFLGFFFSVIGLIVAAAVPRDPGWQAMPPGPSPYPPGLPVSGTPAYRQPGTPVPPKNGSTGMLVTSIFAAVLSLALMIDTIVYLSEIRSWGEPGWAYNYYWRGNEAIFYIINALFLIVFGIFLFFLVKRIASGSYSGIARGSRAAALASAIIIFLAGVFGFLEGRDRAFLDPFFSYSNPHGTYMVIPALLVAVSLGLTVFLLGRLVVEGDEATRYRMPMVACATLFLVLFILSGLMVLADVFYGLPNTLTDIVYGLCFIALGVLFVLISQYVSEKNPTSGIKTYLLGCSVCSVTLIAMTQAVKLIFNLQGGDSAEIVKAQLLLYALSCMSLSATFILLSLGIRDVAFNTSLVRAKPPRPQKQARPVMQPVFPAYPPMYPQQGMPYPQAPVVQPPQPVPTRDCPFCAEPINAKAIKCKHCGSMLDEAR